MSMTLFEALRQVRLEPGAIRARVDGFEVAVRVSRVPARMDPPPDGIGESLMADAPWFPDTTPGFAVTARLGEPTPPDPVVIEDFGEGSE